MPVSPSFADFDDRLISSIEFEGLDRVSHQRILNLIQATVGEPYLEEIVQGDVYTLTHLGEFNYISADVVLQEDGTVHLIYEFREQQIITQVSVVGNSLVSDAELIAAMPLMQGLGRDQDAIDRGRRAIMDMYKEKGNYLVEVLPEVIEYGKDVDEYTGFRIDESVVLIYNIMEGPRVRVKGVSFFGNRSFSAKELSAEIDTNVSVPFFRRGELNEQVLDSDKMKLKRFYTDRGYSDIRVSYTDPLSPDDREASVAFIIEEGPQYTIGGISSEIHTVGNYAPVFSTEQILGLIPLNKGDVYRQVDVNEAAKVINRAYGVLGRMVDVEPRKKAINRAKQAMFGGSGIIEQEVTTAVPYHAQPGVTVHIVFVIQEGTPTRVGLVEIKGNTVTKDKVIRGRIGLKPGYPFDVEEVGRTKIRLMKTRLFNKVTMTIQPPDPNNPNVRDLHVKVDESQTGSLGFGVMAGSDTGMMGNISLSQRNFDVADWPESWEEFWQRKAFVGAGQQFNMLFQPGAEMFNYEMSLTEPRFLDTDYSLGGRTGWQMRNYGAFVQETFFNGVTLGRRFGDIWSGNVSMAFNRIKMTDFDNNVPLEVFNDRGPNTINSIGVSATRNTLNPYMNPIEGSRLSLSAVQFGIPSGDYSFTKTHLSYTTYFAVERDFLDRVTTIRLDGRIGYITGGTSPTFEKFYLGGRTLRGFDTRTVSPRGTPRVAGGDPNIPVGGDWKIFMGAQYEFPIVDRFISMVVFCDSGTVLDSPSFDDYRVSVGTGIRLHIPQLGQVPLAFDFGFPIMKLDTDKKKTFSFSVQLPF